MTLLNWKEECFSVCFRSKLVLLLLSNFYPEVSGPLFLNKLVNVKRAL